MFTGCRVDPLINAGAYFQALAGDLARLAKPVKAYPPGRSTGRQAGGHAGRSLNGNGKDHPPNPAAPYEFLFIAGYVVNLVYPGDPLMIPGEYGPVRLLDVLIEKARQGVDVRLLAWIPWTLALAGRIDIRPESADNMRTVLQLRQEPALQHKVCLNVVSHPAGSAHAKLVVMGRVEPRDTGNQPDWAVGYTGGIDFSPDRARPDWLDVQARVTGPAVQHLYDFFGQMWNQNLMYAGFKEHALVVERNGPEPKKFGFRLPRARHPTLFNGRVGSVEGVVAGTPPVEARRLPQAPQGALHVQPLVTLPAFKYAISPLLPKIRVAPLQFAPRGRFEVRAGLKKAILAAERYIYIEDQYLWSLEVMAWISLAVRRQPELRVILVTGVSDQLGERLEAYRFRALADGLLDGLDETQRRQIGVYQHPLNIHSKTTLIDDRWTLIGSANIARRSLYTDLEHGVAIYDPAGQFTHDYRVQLWGSRMGLAGEQQAQLSDLACALQLWKERWGEGCLAAMAGTTGERAASTWLPPNPLRRIDRSVPEAIAFDTEWYQMIDDPDSRQPWYFPLRREYPQY